MSGSNGRFDWSRSVKLDALEDDLSVKATKGVLRDYVGLLSSTAPASYYLMVFDKAVALVNGDVPIWAPLISAPGGSIGYDFGDSGINFASGLRIAWSTTHTTLTLPAASYGLFSVRYR